MDAGLCCWMAVFFGLVSLSLLAYILLKPQPQALDLLWQQHAAYARKAEQKKAAEENIVEEKQEA